MLIADRPDRPPAQPTRGSAAPRHSDGGALALVRRRPVVTFFVLTFVLSWLAWLPYILSLDGIGLWQVTFPDVLGSTQLSGILPGAYLGPIGSALFVTAVVDGRAGLRKWAGRLFRWRVNWRWYAITLLSVPIGMIIAGWVFSGGVMHAPSMMVLAAYAPALLLQVITTGLAEEPGWRDFALARMQHTMGPLRSSFILGPLWGVWHLPLFLTADWGGWPDASWTRPVMFVLFAMAFNVVMSWVFNRTGESLPMSMLMHVSVNTFASTVGPQMFPTLDADATLLSVTAAAVVAGTTLLIVTRGRLGFTARASSGATDRTSSGSVDEGRVGSDLGSSP